MSQINLWTGLSCHEITVKPTDSLEDIRKAITPSIIGEDESANKIWRFIANVIQIDVKKIATIPYNDAVTGKQVERMLNAMTFINGRNTLYMCDVNQTTPDLIGLKTEKYMNDAVDCWIYKYDELSAGKFQPLLLERVRPLKDISTIYNNVLVCQEGTAIEIQATTKGYGCFGYSVTSDAGEVIVSKLYSHARNTSEDAWTMIRRYQNKDSAIVVDAIPTTIPSKERFKHSRLTIKFWRVYSFEDKNGKKIEFKYHGPAASPAAAYASDRDAIVLPRDGIKQGKVTEGEATNIEFGSIYNVKEDTDEILGIIQLDLFVFQSMEAAQKIFQINMIPIEY